MKGPRGAMIVIICTPKSKIKLYYSSFLLYSQEYYYVSLFVYVNSTLSKPTDSAVN